MPDTTLRDRLRYRLDNVMSRGPAPLIGGLFLVTAAVVIVVSMVVYVLGWANRPDSPFDFLDVLWRALLTTLDSGAVGNYTDGTNGPSFLLSMLAVTLAGILVTSILIGLLVTGIEGRLEQLRKGRSRVIESGHTVILGWSQQIYTIIGELVVANANQRRSSIVVLADRGKVEMEDDIRDRAGRTGRTRIVCRSGNPVDIGDLELVSLKTAKSIVVLSPDSPDADASVIKTILAITNHPQRRPEPYHIVAEVREAANLDVARMVGRDEAELLLVGDLIARIIAQTCRQSGLSAVYTELLDFDGDEIYMVAAPPALVGRTYGEALFAYDDSAVIGIIGAGRSPRLNPPMDTPIGADDRLIAISADDDTVRPASQPIDGVLEGLIVAPVRHDREPEQTLILGWNRRAPAIVRELDAYVAPGSRLVVVADAPDIAASLSEVIPGLRNETVEVRRGDTTERALIDSLDSRAFDHIIVLCSDTLEPQLADSRTLITLLHLRDIASRFGHAFSITSEMLDFRNRALAEVTRADDFIVSDRMTSLLLSQVSENKHLKAVFDDLFAPDGSEIYLRPAAEYVLTGRPMTFATILESARRRGETAIGYRHAAHAEDASQGYGVTLNPVKSAALTLEPGDRVIVLADEGFNAA